MYDNSLHLLFNKRKQIEMDCHQKDYSPLSSSPYEDQRQSYVACYLEQEGRTDNRARLSLPGTSILFGDENAQLSNYQQRMNEYAMRRYSSIASSWSSNLSSYPRHVFSTIDSSTGTSCPLSGNVVSSCMYGSQRNGPIQSLLNRPTDSWIQDLSQGEGTIEYC